MSNPTDNKVDTKDIEAKVSNILSTVVSDDGKLDWSKLDEDISPELKVAVTAEKRRRDTQADYTRKSQAIKALEAEKEELTKLVQERLATLPQDKQAELEDLKWSDPDAYAEKLIQYRQEAKASVLKETEELLASAKSKALNDFTKEQQSAVLDEYNRLNPQTPITEEQLKNDIPVGLASKIANGDISFEDALREASKFIYGKVVVANEPTLQQPTLGDKGGSGGTGNKPPQAQSKDIIW